MGMRTLIDGLFLVSLFVIVSSPSAVLYAEDKSSKQPTSRGPNEDLNTMAANAIDDTLKACLARIPQLATPGQRLLAEQNCRGEEKARQATQATPVF